MKIIKLIRNGYENIAKKKKIKKIKEFKKMKIKLNHVILN